MKDCLNCEKKFKEKRETAKFCSTNCRVKWHKKNGKKKKEAISEVQMQVLYNSILAAVEKIGTQNGLPSPVGVVVNQQIRDEPLSFDKLKAHIPPPDRIDTFAAELHNAPDLGKLEAIGHRISKSSLNWKDRQYLQNLGKQIANAKFID